MAKLFGPESQKAIDNYDQSSQGNRTVMDQYFEEKESEYKIKERAQALEAPMFSPDDLIGSGIFKGIGIAAAGIIGGGRATAQALESSFLKKVVNQAEELHKSGVSNLEISRITKDLLDQYGNPHGAKSIFIGPDNKSRMVLSNKEARLANTIVKQERTNRLGSFESRELFEPDRKQVRINYPTKVVEDKSGWRPVLRSQEQPIPLSDALLHPTAYNISPSASNATMEYSLTADINGSMGVTADGKKVLTGSGWAGKRVIASGKENLEEALLHETNHLVQIDQGLRLGTSPTVEGLRTALQEAKTKGSFKSKERLEAYETILERMAMSRYRTPGGDINERGQALLDALYKSNYGEWEARAGSQYAEDTLPIFFERGKTW